MRSVTLSNLVRTAIIGMLACLLVGGAFVLPAVGTQVRSANPGLADAYWPWLGFLWATCLPCLAILVLFWKVSTNIRVEKVFSLATAHWVKAAALLLFAAVGWFFVGNVVLLLAGLSHPAVALLSLFIDVLALAIAVLLAVLSRYLTTGSALQAEVDATV